MTLSLNQIVAQTEFSLDRLEPLDHFSVVRNTVFFTNLGMLGMNVGLDVRVIDQIGLANPLAAHTARIEDGRIGHDKNLFPDWAVAEGPFL